MPKLTDEIKAFIVKNLACYDTPSQVAAAVKACFGIDVSRQQIYRYDPGCAQPPAQRWSDLHAATRRVFLGQVSDIGIAQKVVRLQKLDRYAEEAEDAGQHIAAARFLVQAAKECGGIYESRNAPLSKGASLTGESTDNPAF